MIGDTFQYKSVGRDKNVDVDVDLYHFDCLFNQTYILEVEHHKYNIYFIKFFKKNRRHSKNRYSLINTKSLYKKPEAAKNFLMILNTVIEVITLTYKDDRIASFGFMGAPTEKELSEKNEENINEDGTVNETQRFNIYSIYVTRYFDPKEFNHISIPESSCYLIKSIDSKKLTTDKIEKFFTNYIETYS